MIRKDRLAVVFAVLACAAAGVLAPLSGAQQFDPQTMLVQPPQTEAAVAAYRQAAALYDQRRFAEALDQVEQALKLDPNLPDAQLLKSRIQSELLVATPPRAAGAKPPAGSPPEQLLSEAEINRIRMFELSDAELKSARGTVAPADLEEFWRTIILKDPNETAVTAQDRTHFLAANNFGGQIAKIRGEHAVGFYDKVHLTNEPASFRSFKSHVQPYVLQTCATCHGGDSAMIFRLYGAPNGSTPATERETYTNFLILCTVGAHGHELIDRADPERSLILQYILPAADAALTHPKVDGREIGVNRVTSHNDQRYRDILDWAKSLAYPQPNYDIKYQMAAHPAATAPAAPH